MELRSAVDCHHPEILSRKAKIMPAEQGLGLGWLTQAYNILIMVGA